MTHAARSAPSQATLFNFDGTPDADRVRLQIETTSATLSVMRDKRSEARLEKLASSLRRSVIPLDRARIAGELRELADTALAVAIGDARDAGRTWRDIGNELGIPFQTLYRRYGETEKS